MDILDQQHTMLLVTLAQVAVARPAPFAKAEGNASKPHEHKSAIACTPRSTQQPSQFAASFLFSYDSVAPPFWLLLHP